MRQTILKDNRIDLRVKTDQKEFLNYAASLQNMSLSVFVMASALKEAEEIMAEKVHFALPAKQWQTFCAKLDRPVREITQLKKLFSKPSVFDE